MLRVPSLRRGMEGLGLACLTGRPPLGMPTPRVFLFELAGVKPSSGERKEEGMWSEMAGV